MVWYEILGVAIPVLIFLGFLFKNAKWKRIIENTTIVLEETRKALMDGKITKAEWLNIVATALTVFIPEAPEE